MSGRGTARWCRASDADLCRVPSVGESRWRVDAERGRRPRAVLAVAPRPRLRRVLSLTARRARRALSRAPAARPVPRPRSPSRTPRNPNPHAPPHPAPPPSVALVLALVAVLALGACSRRETPAAPSGGAGASAAGTPAAELRLGYFPNITHAPALIGVANGYFQQELGSTKLTTQTFNAGPEEVSALLGGSLDAGFIGSAPAINAFAKSNGQAVRLIAGSTSGGAQLVVSPDITSAEQLKGKIVATPQAGNTQDIAFKKWLKQNNLQNGTGPDAVTVQNIDNPRTLDLFKSKQVAGGWLPEPWSSRLVDAGAKVLVDEKTLWPDGQFPTHGADRPHPVPAGAPADRRGAAARRAEGDRLRHHGPGPGQDRHERRDQEDHQLVAGAGRARPRPSPSCRSAPTRSRRRSRSWPRTASRPG